MPPRGPGGRSLRRGLPPHHRAGGPLSSFAEGGCASRRGGGGWRSLVASSSLRPRRYGLCAGRCRFRVAPDSAQPTRNDLHSRNTIRYTANIFSHRNYIFVSCVFSTCMVGLADAPPLRLAVRGDRASQSARARRCDVSLCSPPVPRPLLPGKKGKKKTKLGNNTRGAASPSCPSNLLRSETLGARLR